MGGTNTWVGSTCMHACMPARLWLLLYANVHFLCVLICRHLNKRACMYVRMNACLCKCLCPCLCLCPCSCLCVCQFTYVYLSIDLSLYVYLYACLCLQADMYTCTYVYVYIYMYVRNHFGRSTGARMSVQIMQSSDRVDVVGVLAWAHGGVTCARWRWRCRSTGRASRRPTGI